MFYDPDAHRAMCGIAAVFGRDVDDFARSVGLAKSWRNGRHMCVSAGALHKIFVELGVHPREVSPSFMDGVEGEPPASVVGRWSLVLYGRTFAQEVAARGGSRYIALRAIRDGVLPSGTRSVESSRTRRIMRDMLGELSDFGMPAVVSVPDEGGNGDKGMAARMFAAGLTYAEIARRLGVSRQAVNKAFKVGRGSLFKRSCDIIEEMERESGNDR